MPLFEVCMKFKFIGEGVDDKDVVNMFGIKFILGGDAVEVSAPDVIQKLLGNSHFISVEEPKVKHGDVSRTAKTSAE